jgi:hypothetical protein
MATIPSTFDETRARRTATYSEVQKELRWCKQGAVGNDQVLRDRLVAYIRLAASASPERPTRPGEPDAAPTTETPAPSQEATQPGGQQQQQPGDQQPMQQPVPGAPTTQAAPAATAPPVPANAPSSGATMPLVFSAAAPFAASGGFGGGTDDESQGDGDSDGSGDGSGSDDSDDDDDVVVAAASQPATKRKKRKKGDKAAHFNANDCVRLMHCLLDPEGRTALGAMMKKTRDQVDAGYEPFTEIAAIFNNPDKFFDHIALNEHAQDVSTPRIKIRTLDPNHHVNEDRDPGKLRKKFSEIKGWVTPFFKKWNASGQMTADTSEKSITDFLRPKNGDEQEHPKEKIIKYVHLLLKGDEDLMTFASKDIGKHGRESGVTSPPQQQQPAAKRARGLDRSDLVAAMSVETDSAKKMAAAWQTEAEAKLLSSCTTAIERAVQLDEDNPLRALLEAKIKKMLGAPPETPAADAPATQAAAAAEPGA